MNLYIPLLILVNVLSVTSFQPKPNFLIILADDLGYGDLDQPNVDTPELKKLRESSVEFTSAYSADSVCTPSRAALLTGRYPIRSGLANNFNRTFYGPGQNGGLPRWTLPFTKIFQNQSYSTALVGKWHLGINNATRDDGFYLPLNYGFDYYYGLPMGNTFMCEPFNQDPTGCFLYDQDQIVEQPINTDTINERLLNRTLQYIQELPQPWLINYWSIYTHTPLYPKIRGRSKRGTYGDVMMELSEQVGILMDSLPPNTYVIFTSDNGPFIEEFPDSGSPGPLKGSKGQVFEAGIRVPFLVYHESLTPKRIHDTISLMDIFPSILELAGLPAMPPDFLDGVSFVDMLEGNYAPIERFLIHYCGATPIALRYGKYKIFYAEQIWSDDNSQTCQEIIIPTLPYGACGCEAENLKYIYPPKIYDMDLDIQEKFPLNYMDYMDIILDASTLLELHMEELIAVKDQLNAPLNEELAPCCNYPACFCVE